MKIKKETKISADNGGVAFKGTNNGAIHTNTPSADKKKNSLLNIVMLILTIAGVVLAYLQWQNPVK